MAGRSSTTFKKRQKELARQDKQREKAAKRVQRKQDKLLNGPDDGTYVPDPDDDLEPFASEEEDRPQS